MYEVEQMCMKFRANVYEVPMPREAYSHKGFQHLCDYLACWASGVIAGGHRG